MGHPQLTTAAARRIAVAAQGLDRPRPGRAATMRHLDRVVDRIALVQIDSVSVVARAHLLTLSARLGPYPAALVERAAARPPRHLVEVWGHEACFVAPATYGLLDWRAQAARVRAEANPGSVVRRRPELVDAVYQLLESRGPLTAAEAQVLLDEPGGQAGGWWNRSDTKHALEYLFAIHEAAVAGRTAGFQRRYDIAERVVPDAVRRHPNDRAEAMAGLVELAARAHGVGTVRCFADYFRIPTADAVLALAELRRQGVVEEVRVEAFGDRPAYLHQAARRPRTVRADALLAPFDSLVFDRRRLASLFAMHYRIGIYTPAHQRTHGYYALPYLAGEQIVGRVDLKADKRVGALRVLGYYPEPGVGVGQVEARLTARLEELAQWLGLGRVDGHLTPSRDR